MRTNGLFCMQRQGVHQIICRAVTTHENVWLQRCIVISHLVSCYFEHTFNGQAIPFALNGQLDVEKAVRTNRFDSQRSLFLRKSSELMSMML